MAVDNRVDTGASGGNGGLAFTPENIGNTANVKVDATTSNAGVVSGFANDYASSVMAKPVESNPTIETVSPSREDQRPQRQNTAASTSTSQEMQSTTAAQLDTAPKPQQQQVATAAAPLAPSSRPVIKQRTPGLDSSAAINAASAPSRSRIYRTNRINDQEQAQQEVTTNASPAVATAPSIADQIKESPITGDVTTTDAAKQAKPIPDTSPRLYSSATSNNNAVAEQVKGTSTVPTGTGVSAPMVVMADADLSIEEVSIGTDELLEACRLGSPLLERIKKLTNLNDLDADAFNDPTTASELVSKLMGLINTMDIPVVTVKHPVSEDQSHQRRILRVHAGTGISLNPLVAKTYNADFDGDEMVVIFDEASLALSPWAADCLAEVDQHGVAIDFDFAPMPSVSSKQSFVPILLDSAKENGIELKEGIARAFSESVYLLNNDPDNGAELFVKTAMSISNRRDRVAVVDLVVRACYQQAKLAVYARDEASEFIAPEINEYRNLTDEERNLLDYIVSSKTPPTYTQFVNAIAKFSGDIKKKNTHFRVGADLGKLIKIEPGIYFGEDSENKTRVSGTMTLRDLHTASLRFKVSQQIAGKKLQKNNQLSMSEYKKIAVRTHMIKIGLSRPTRDNFSSWYANFAMKYNNVTYQITEAKKSYRLDMSSVSMSDIADKSGLPDDIRKVSVPELAKAFVEIYGDISIQSLFGNYDRYEYLFDKVNPKYGLMSLRRFSKENMWNVSGDIDTERFANGNGIVVSDPVSLLINGVANERRSSNNGYNADLNENLEAQISIFSRIKAKLKIADGDAYKTNVVYEEAVDLLYSCGEELYQYYGMDSVETFINSPWFDLMLDAETPEQLGGIRYAMIADMKLDSFANLVTELQEATAEDSKMSIEEQQYIVQQINHEMGYLSSQSMLWSAMIGDIQNGNALWKELANDPSAAIAKYIGIKSHSNIAGANLNIEFKWNNAIEFVADPFVDKNIKDIVLSDLTRMYVKYDRIESFEMAGMLEVDASPIYSGINNDTYNEASNNAIKEATKRMNRDIDDSYIDEGKVLSEQDIEDLIQYLDDPHNYYRIPDDMYHDAINAPADKNYEDTEKSRQQAPVNGLYNALCEINSGGLYSDVFRGDNKVLNKIGFDQLTAYDFIHVLANEDIEIEVYDQMGKTAILSKRNLLEGYSGVHEFFNKNPRLFAMLRPMQPSFTRDSHGKIYAAVRLGIKDTMSEMSSVNNDSTFKALQELRDKPGWGALVNLFTPIHGMSTLNRRRELKKTELWLLNRLIDMKMRNVSNEDILSQLGIHEKYENEIKNHIIAQIKNRLSKERGKRGFADPVDIDFENVSLTKEVSRLLDEYSRIDSIPEKKIESPSLRGYIPSTDAESAILFFDVRQTLTGAKTAASTSIEGYETTKNFSAMPLYANIPNVWAMDGDSPYRSEGIEMRDSAGAMLGRMFQRAAAKVLAVKRSWGGEKFNLKAKKSGDDGKDSISKALPNGKYVSDIDKWNTVESNVKAIYLEDPAKAETILGNYLKERNDILGYTSFSKADWYNVAHMLIGVINGEVVIRSQEQISTAVRYSLPHMMDLSDLDNIDLNEYVQCSMQVLESCGSAGADLLGMAYSIRVAGPADFKPAVRQRSNSSDRNFEKIREINIEIAKKNSDNPHLVSATSDFKKNQERRLRDKFGISEDEFKWTKKGSAYSIMGVFVNGENSVRGDYALAPGTSNVLLVKNPNDKEAFSRANELAKEYKMTLVYPSNMAFPDSIMQFGPNPMKNISIPCPEDSDYVMVPYFEMELNGWFDPKTNSWGEVYSGRNIVSYDNFTVIVEDSMDEFNAGDAGAIPTDTALQRIKIEDSDLWEDDAFRMFAPSLDGFARANGSKVFTYSFDMASEEDLERIVNFAKNRDYGPEDIEFDIGVAYGNKKWDSINNHFQYQLREFANNFDPITGQVVVAKPDRIVGFAVMTVSNGDQEKKIFAPIIPFRNLKGMTKSVPRSFSIDMPTHFDPSTSTFKFKWTNTTGIEGQAFKLHEGTAGANKMMVFGKSIGERKLKTGTNVDFFISENTTASRRIAWNKRLQTMYSMVVEARRDPRFGYNFAELDDALPNSPNLKKRLLDGTLLTRDISSLNVDKVLWHNDPNINDFVRNSVKMCLRRGINPADFLCSRYINADGQYVNTMFYYEYDLLFEPSYDYQNRFMKFYNAMMPSLCPPTVDSIDDDLNEVNIDDYYFRPSQKSDWSYGCLQRQVPRINPETGKTTYTWENVYTSFGIATDDYTGFHAPSVDVAKGYMQELSASMLAGNRIKPNSKWAKYFIKAAFSDHTVTKKLWELI